MNSLDNCLSLPVLGKKIISNVMLFIKIRHKIQRELELKFLLMAFITS